MAGRIEEISLDKIKVQKHNVRRHDIDVGIEDLAANIRANGLLQPIAAYQESDGYVILTGQRRLNAYHMLNEKYPDRGFDNIPCLVIDEPESDEKKISLSLAENITQLPMTNPDLVKAVTDLYNVYGDYEMVEKEFGLTPYMVKKYVRISRLPPRLRDAIRDGEIHSNPTRAENAALRAVDAVNYTKNGTVPEQVVVDLAVEMAKGEYNPADLANEAKKTNNIEDIKEGAKKKRKHKIPIELSTEVSDKLDVVADSNGESRDLKATQYVIDGVEKDYSQLE